MADKVTMQIIFDETHGRTNLAFSGKPSEEIRNEMKANGWRWSSLNKVWYPRVAEGSTEFAHQLQEKYFAEQNEQNKLSLEKALEQIVNNDKKEYDYQTEKMTSYYIFAPSLSGKREVSLLDWNSKGDLRVSERAVGTPFINEKADEALALAKEQIPEYQWYKISHQELLIRNQKNYDKVERFGDVIGNEQTQTQATAQSDELFNHRGWAIKLRDGTFWENTQNHVSVFGNSTDASTQILDTGIVGLPIECEYKIVSEIEDGQELFDHEFVCGLGNPYQIEKTKTGYKLGEMLVNESDIEKAFDLVCSYKNFDNALDAHKAGQLPDGYVFNLGKPGEILQKCGFPEHHNIELSAKQMHIKMLKHDFTELDIKGLDKALQNPVAVFEYNNRAKSQNVIVELQKDGKNFLAGVHFNQTKNGIEVSDVRGLFNRNNMDWLRWIEHGKMIYGDKEKIQVLASQQRSNFAEVAGTDARSSSDTYYLDSVDNILQEFGDVKQIFTDDFSDYKKYKERFEVYKALDNYYREYPFDRELIHEQTNEFYEAWKNKDIQTLHKYWVKENDLSETVRTFLVNNDKEIVDNMAFYNYVANGKIQESVPQEQIQLTEKDLALAKQIIPPNQYATTLELTQGEDGDFFKRKIQEVAQIAERLYSAKKTNVNKDGTHPLELHYFDSRSNSDWYINELTDAGTAFGYAIINGDTQMAEWGYIDINEIFEACPYVELDYHVPEGMTIEQVIKKEQTKTQEQSTETAQNDNTIKYTVYHIKDGDEYFYLRNRSYEGITKLGLRFDKNNYEEVYHGEIPVSDDTVVGEGDMYFPAAKLNNDEYIQEEIARRLTTPPTDYPLPFLILGDVVVYEVDGVKKAFYTDISGMTMNDEITRQFVTETQEQKADPKITKGTAKKIREQCRQILQKPDSEITEADKQILASYEGAGGLHEENQSASGVLSEFYTPQNIIDATWQLVDYYAPDAKTVLEPSAGTGRFARGRDDKEFTMHELDETSARIAKLLHPDANVIVGAYQKQFFDENERVLNKNYEQPKYDIVIGNPPYGDYKDKYKGLGEGKDFDRYEEYFISKGLDSLKDENSILAMVVPSGFLNSAKDKQKEIIAEKGVLVNAYRLPEGAFPSTQVGTDIVIFQKTNNKLFEQTGDRTLLDIRLKNISDNNYFTEFPQNILGEERTRINRFGREESYVALPEEKTIDDMLSVITQNVAAHTAEREKMREQFTNMGKEFGEAISNVVKEDLHTVGRKVADIKPDTYTAFIDDEEKMFDITQLLEDEFLEKYSYLTKEEYDLTSNELTKIFDAVYKNKIPLTLEQKKVLDNLNKKLTSDPEIVGLYFGNYEIEIFHFFDMYHKSQLVNDLTEKPQTVQNTTKLSEAVIVKPATTRTEQTEKPARRKTYQKETVRIKKSKGEVMSAKEFTRLYNKDIDERELPIWRATDWEGNIDTAELSKESLEFMKTSGSYSEVDFRNGKWQHNAIFLSGDIQKKIDDQKEMLEKAAAAEQWVKERIEKNIANLENVIPNQLSMDNIHIGVKTNLAESFTVDSVDADGNPVAINLQEAFIYWAQGTIPELQTSRHHIDWSLANISREELPTNVTWNDIVEYIDGVPVRAQATRYSWGSESKDELKAKRAKEADEKRAARRETADKLFDRFLHEGLGENDKRRFVSEYNKMFNSYVAPDYSKLPLAIEGMSAYKGNEKFRLYDQQIQGVSFLCNKGNGLLAYDVGLGKTACGIVATVNQIQTGRAERPLIVVPNAVYAKWLTDIQQLFPNVKVNDLYNLNANVIEKYKGTEPHSLNLEKGSISLCTYEALQNITFTDESCSNELFEDFKNLLSIDMDETDSGRKKAKGTVAIVDVIGSASHVKDENYVFFENCGFDNLTVDEAHNFKNLWVVPKPKEKGQANEYAGIPSGNPSARAKKMFAMTQLVQRHNNNRNVFMLSATPFTNSPVEVYSMMSYIGRERLKASGINSLGDFMNMYANTKNELGVNTKGEIAYKQVMKNWKELPALQNLLTEFIDKRDCEEANIVRPYKTQKKVEIEMTDLQKKIIAAETERIYENKNPGDTLVAMNNMRLALVSPTLLDASNYTNTDIEIPSFKEFVESSPKLKFVCDSIIDMYKQHPDKGQFMYMPLGKTGHSIVKDYLVQHGIPKDAVEIISGEVNNTPEKKEKITTKFNDAENKLKIIIGGKNTSEGIDLNGNSFVMYNCSLGWNPSETVQAEGRIWRQGNRQGQVYTVYPIMYDSIDSLLFQKHDEKMSRINELWTYKGDTMNVEGLKPEELKFDLIKDPSRRAKLILDEQTKELKAELAKAELKQITFDELLTKSEKVKADILDAKDSIEYYQKNGAGFAWQQERIKKYKKDLKKFELQEKTVKEKLNAMGLTSDEKIAEHGMRLANEKKLLEEQIENKVKEMPEIIKQMKTKQLEQNLLDRPFEETRKEFVSSVASNLRSMQDVKNEIRTERHEKMLAEKLEKGEISNDERDVFSKAGWKNYRQFTEGEISFDELKNPNHTQKENITVDKNEQASKKTDIEQKLQDVSPTNSVDENGQGNLFNFICAETSLNNDATYKVDKYRGNPLDPSITRDGINEAKAARARHTKEVLTGEQKCLWKCFKDFKTHNVFDIQGKKIEFDKDGKMSKTSWKQLKAAMDIYRDKRFESFRYLLIDKETGQVRDQLALAVKMPHISFADAPDKSTTKKVLERAEKNNCFIVAVHNHPSGDIEPSPQDIATTKILENAFTPEGSTESLLKGHIILDHDTFSLYTKETGWTKCDSEKQLGYDPIGNELPEWAKVTNGGISNDVDLLKIAESINDYYEWHKDYVPFIFTSNPTIMAVQYYHVDFIANRDELVNGRRTVDWIVQDAKDMGATNIFPIITEDLKWKMEKDHILEIDEDGTIYADNPALERLVHEFHFDNTMRGSSVVTDGIIGKETFVKYTRSLYPNEDLFYDDRKRDNISIKETSTWDGEIEHKTNDKSNRKEIER